MNRLRAFTIALSLYVTVVIYKDNTKEPIAVLPFENMSLYEFNTIVGPILYGHRLPNCCVRLSQVDYPALIPSGLRECL
jgi:hypothetical protein